MILSYLFPARRDPASASYRFGLSEAVIAAVLSYICLVLGQSLIFFVLSPYFSQISGTLALFGAALSLLPILVFSYYQKASIQEILYLKKKKSFRFSLLGLLGGAGLAALLFGILFALRAYTCTVFYANAVLFLPLLFFAFIVQGSAEELLFRGFLMSALCAHYGGVVSALTSALAFAALHAMNPGASLLGILNVFLFGLLFAALTQRTQSIFFACAMHAGWNFAESLIGLEISGNASLHPVFSPESRMPYLTGGAFGPEASPLLTGLLVLLLILIALCSFLSDKKDTRPGKKMT